MMVTRRLVGAGVAVLLMGSLFAGAAQAGLALELHEYGDWAQFLTDYTYHATGGDMVIALDNPTDPIRLEVWGVVTPTDPALWGQQRLSTISYAAFSSDSNAPDLLRGLTELKEAVQGGGFPPADPTVAPIVSWTFQSLDPTGQGGTVVDVHADGDMDAWGGVLETNPEIAYSFWSTTATPPNTPGQHILAYLDFTPEGVWNDPTKATTLEVIGGPNTSWIEDGTTTIFGDPEILNKAILVITSDALPVALLNDGRTGALGGDLELDGSAATGSVNYWKYVFGGGLYVFETNDPLAVIPVADLEAAGLPLDGSPIPVEVTVGWEYNPVVNEDTEPFDVTLTPEPATMALLGLGLAVLARRRRK